MYPKGHQVSVLLSAEDYAQVLGLVKRGRSERPDYSVGDLVRGYIRRGLEKEEPGPARPRRDPKDNHVRQLHALSRAVRRIARELQQNGAKK